RDLLARDTSFQSAEEAPMFSCPQIKRSRQLRIDEIRAANFKHFSRVQDSKGKTAVSNTARIHEFGFRILEQLLNDCFHFISIRDLGIDHVVICIVSAERAAIAKIRRIFSTSALRFPRLSVNKN